MPDFKPGIYRHWKGALYRALFLAQDSTNRITIPTTTKLDGSIAKGSTEEPMVVYVCLDGEHAGNVCARSLAQWNERVDWLDTGNGPFGIRPRFEWRSP